MQTNKLIPGSYVTFKGCICICEVITIKNNTQSNCKAFKQFKDKNHTITPQKIITP